MNISRIDRKVLKIISTAKTIKVVTTGAKERKFMNDSYYRFSEVMGQPLSTIQNLTKDATMDQFTFLKTMVNKFNYEKVNSIKDSSDHILNIYSMVEKPTVQHLNIVRKTKDSFESVEKIFSLAKDDKTLRYVEDLQYGELKNSKNPSKIIIDLLNSKNLDKYMFRPERYSSYIELHANEEDAIKKLDKLVDAGKFSRFRSDAQLAVKKLFKQQRIEVAMAGKTSDLENMYTKDRANFLTTLVNNFIPARKAPKEETKSVVVDMYGTMDSSNAKLRQTVAERFSNLPVKDRTAEIVEMQTLFNRIDKDNDAKTFVQKAINKDLKIASIAELNEVLDNTPLKKANIFFNNAKRIIERSTGEERKQALTVELENPFFESKAPKEQKRMVRMFSDRPQKDDFFTKTAKIIENKINQYRYSRMSA